MVDWLKQIDVLVAWLSLDEADNDLPRFLAYPATAFQQVDEESGAFLFSAVQSPISSDQDRAYKCFPQLNPSKAS